MTPPAEQLALGHLRDAVRMAGAVGRGWRWLLDDDDLRGLAWAALWDAATSYDPQAGTKFVTWLFYRVRSTVLNEIRRETRRRAGPLEADLPAAAARTLDAFEEITRTLKPLERSLLYRLYIDRETIPEIAATLGVSRWKISRLVQRALGRIRQTRDREELWGMVG